VAVAASALALGSVPVTHGPALPASARSRKRSKFHLQTLSGVMSSWMSPSGAPPDSEKGGAGIGCDRESKRVSNGSSSSLMWLRSCTRPCTMQAADRGSPFFRTGALRLQKQSACKREARLAREQRQARYVLLQAL
jgi:hypothetical protein